MKKITHLIAVRKDLQYFQHLHPSFNVTSGEFEIPILFPAEGEYRLFADFVLSNSPVGHDGKKAPKVIRSDIF